MIVQCTKCNAFVETEENGSFSFSRKSGKLSGKYTLLKCKNCEEPILVKQDNIGNTAEGDIFDTPTVVFPIEEIKNNSGIPQQLKNLIEEAKACYKVNAFSATALMCRKTLEGICKFKEIKSKNLMTSIKELKENGVIDNQLLEWAEILRITGNSAAHDVQKKISKEDARDTLDFTNAMLEYIFMFKEKLEEFKKRRLTTASTL